VCSGGAGPVSGLLPRTPDSGGSTYKPLLGEFCLKAKQPAGIVTIVLLPKAGDDTPMQAARKMLAEFWAFVSGPSSPESVYLQTRNSLVMMPHIGGNTLSLFHHALTPLSSARLNHAGESGFALVQRAWPRLYTQQRTPFFEEEGT